MLVDHPPPDSPQSGGSDHETPPGACSSAILYIINLIVDDCLRSRAPQKGESQYFGSAPVVS